jgi:alanyl-tRNA synthetase
MNCPNCNHPKLKKAFSGKLVFELKTVHGFPLDFAVDKIVNDRGFSIDWPEFVDTARANLWWDFQTFKVIQEALKEAQVPPETIAGITHGLRLYILNNPHPMVPENT